MKEADYIDEEQLRSIEEELSVLNKNDIEEVRQSERGLPSLQELEAQDKQEDITTKKDNRKKRGIFSYCIFGFVCTYMVAVLVIVFFCGFNVMTIDSKVLIALLSTTTANVIGLFAVVAKYLFHK